MSFLLLENIEGREMLKNIETIELSKETRIKKNKDLKVKIKLDSEQIMKDIREAMRESIKRNMKVII